MIFVARRFIQWESENAGTKNISPSDPLDWENFGSVGVFFWVRAVGICMACGGVWVRLYKKLQELKGNGVGPRSGYGHTALE